MEPKRNTPVFASLFGLQGNKGQVMTAFFMLSPLVGVVMLGSLLYAPGTGMHALDTSDLLSLAPILTATGALVALLLAMWLGQLPLWYMLAAIGAGYACVAGMALWMN